MTLKAINNLWADKDYAEAQQILEEEFALTQDVQAGLALGKTYMLQYDYNKARRHYHTINELSYRNYESMLNMGRIYNWIGEPDEEFFELFLEAFPEDRTGTLELAETQLILNKVAEAQQSLASYPLAADSDPALVYVHALLHHRQGFYTQAIALATPLLESNDAHFALKARLLVIDAYYQLEYYSKCFAHIDIVYGQHPHHLQAQYWQGVKLNEERKYFDAFSLLEVLEREYCSFPLTFIEMGKVEISMGDLTMAEVYFKRATKRGEWYDKGFGQSSYLLSQKDSNNFDLEKIIHLASKPNMSGILFFLGCIYGDVYKDYPKAIEWLEASLRNIPEHVPSKRKLAVYYLENGQREQTIIQSREILEMNPEHQVALLQCARLED